MKVIGIQWAFSRWSRRSPFPFSRATSRVLFFPYKNNCRVFFFWSEGYVPRSAGRALFDLYKSPAPLRGAGPPSLISFSSQASVSALRKWRGPGVSVPSRTRLTATLFFSCGTPAGAGSFPVFRVAGCSPEARLGKPSQSLLEEPLVPLPSVHPE